MLGGILARLVSLLGRNGRNVTSILGCSLHQSGHVETLQVQPMRHRTVHPQARPGLKGYLSHVKPAGSSSCRRSQPLQRLVATITNIASVCLLARLQAVLQASGKLPESSHPIRGWDFDHGRDLDGIMAAMLHSGLQASALGEAVVEVNRMVSYKCCCWHWQCLAVRPLERAGPSQLPMWAVESAFPSGSSIVNLLVAEAICFPVPHASLPCAHPSPVCPAAALAPQQGSPAQHMQTLHVRNCLHHQAV